MEIQLVTSLDEAKRFIIDCFKAVGTQTEYAETLADNLIEADYRGHLSHGMNRIENYIHDIVHQLLDPNAYPEIEKETVATALVNGNNGLGAVVGKYCMDLALKKAKDVGIGFVTAHGSNHYGMAGMYALQALKDSIIGLSFTNTSPVVVPTRAKDAAIGTNPLSIGAPGLNGDSVVLDMATTTVALGKLEINKRKGIPIPEGWALNERGEMETDPDIGLKASRLLPLGGAEITGGYKGYGLGLMGEILTGILSGSKYGPDIPVWNGPEKEVADLAQTFIAIDPKVFAPGFEDRLSNLMDHLRHMEPKDPAKPILVAGDVEKKHMEQVQLQGGICYVKDQHDTNKVLAEKLKVAPMISTALETHSAS